MPSPYIDNVTRNFIRPALRTSPDVVRIGVPEHHVEWLTARSDELVESVRQLSEKVDFVGDVEDLRAQITPASLAGKDLTDEEVLNAALDAVIRQLEFMRDEKARIKERAEERAQQRAKKAARRRAAQGRGAACLRPYAARTRARGGQGAPGQGMSPAEGLRELRALASAYAARTPVSSVAVVGNAPLEPSEERASLIDGADLVIRMNSFVMDRPGAPACQGSRVDVVLWSRLAPATPDLFDRYSERLYVLLEPMRMFGRPEMWPASWPSDLGFVVARNDAVAVPLNDEIGLPWREQHLAPTTGTTGVWLALNLFPEAEVRIAGLSFVDDPGQTRWAHQFGDDVRVGPEHRIAEEARLIRTWLGTGRARMVR